MTDQFPFAGHEHYIAEAARARDIDPGTVAGARQHPVLRAISNELHQVASKARGEAHKAGAGQPSEDLRGLARASLDACRARVTELEVAHDAAIAMLAHAEEMFTDEALTPKPYEPPPKAPEPEAAPAEDESEWVQVPEDEDVDEALEEIDAGEATQGGEAKAKGRRRAKK